MFSTGQLIFAVCFLIFFTIILVVSYKRDKARHRRHYRGTLKVMVGFLLFLACLFFIKYMLKK